MKPFARRRRRVTSNSSPLLTRAFGAACLASATSLSAAFTVTSGLLCGGLCGVTSSPAAVSSTGGGLAAAIELRQRHGLEIESGGGGGGSSPYASSRPRRNQFALVASAIAEPPTVIAGAGAAAAAAPVAGPTIASGERCERSPRRKPSLTFDEERALLAKIKEAHLLREVRERLELAATAANAKGNKAAGRNGGGSVVAQIAVSAEAWAREAGLEVDDLSRVLQEGVQAKRTLVERNMPMVTNVVNAQYRWRLRGGQLSVADLIQEGAYALGLAAERFDPAMQNRFITFALYMVRDKLDVALARGNSAISVPASALKELHRARREITDELGRRPSEVELANFFVNGVVADDSFPLSSESASASAGLTSAGQVSPRRSRAVVGGEFSAKGSADNRDAQQQARIRRRRINLLSAVQRVTSIDRLMRASDGSTMVPLVDTLVEEGDQLSQLSQQRRWNGGDEFSELLPRVLTPLQADLVRMACGLADGRPMSMSECSKELSLSVARTKSLFEGSLEKLRSAAAAENPRRLVRQR